MAEGTIYTRVYSERSAGKLSSGKKPTGNALTHAELLDEFRKHADLRNREPTALISVSSRIIDTIQRAFKKCYAYDELPEDIWIAFIKAPATGHESPTSLHVAQHLAEECELETPGIFRDEDKTPGIFRYEYIFEWVIPDKYVLHQVSLKTLMDRGLDWEKYVFADDRYRKVVSTEKLRERVAVALLPQQAWRDPWESVYAWRFSHKNSEPGLLSIGLLTNCSMTA